MTYKITNKSSYNTSPIEDKMKNFYPYAQKQLGFDKTPSFVFDSDPENAQNILGKTAQYEPNTMTITVFVDSRHPKDILRSLAHELVHHAQNCRGEFKNPTSTHLGYAQEDEHMQEMEREAYEQGNMCFRSWEDGYKKKFGIQETNYKALKLKGETTMGLKDWKNQEINAMLMEKFGYNIPKPTKKVLNEGGGLQAPDFKSNYRTLDLDNQDLEKLDQAEEDEDVDLNLNPHSVESRKDKLELDDDKELNEEQLRSMIDSILNNIISN
jgi:hypothetical protein